MRNNYKTLDCGRRVRVCKILDCNEEIREDNILGLCKDCSRLVVARMQGPLQLLRSKELADPPKGAKNFQTEEELDAIIAEQRRHLPKGWERMGREAIPPRLMKVFSKDEVVINGREGYG